MERRELEKDKNYVLVEYVFGPEEIDRAEVIATRKLNEIVEVPGFRKGRVPSGVLKIRYPEAFKDYVLQALEDKIPSEEEELLEKSLINPMIVESELEDGKARVKVEYHLEPEVKVEGYEGIELKKIKRGELVEKYVERKLEDLREEHALLEEKEGDAEYGDQVRVRMVVTSEAGRVLRDDEYEYILVEEDDRPFVKDLVGKKKGDVVEFDREYKGRKYHYKLELLNVYRRILRELDDEFAKVVGKEFETLEQLKEHLKREGEEAYDAFTKDLLRDQVVEWLRENVEVVISDKTIDRVVEDMIRRLKDEGRYEETLKSFESEEKLREAIVDRFIRNLRETYGIRKIAEIEGIEVSDEEVEKEAEELASLWGISPRKAKALAKNDPRISEDIRWAILKRKVLDTVIDKAKVVEVSEEEFVKQLGGEENEG